MTIIEVFTTLMLACNQIPDKCAIVDNGEKMITVISICNENLTSSQDKYDFILFSKDSPEESRHIYINTECTSA